MATTSETCPTGETLEQIAAGAMPDQEVAAHLSACSACRTALEQIERDNAFLGGFAVAGALPRPRREEASTIVDIPGYEIRGEIHRGGQGVVYHAVQRSTKREVAIKVMRQGPFATIADRSRFDREVEALSKLNHPHIVAVHDAGVAAGFHYFVMNYVDGKTLDEAFFDATAHAAGDRNIYSRGLAMFVKVCDAVHAAHLRGIIHRDLKPSNVRVDRFGEPFVLDFGLAKSTESDGESAMTRTGQFVGSLPWASPEQIEGAAGRIDLRTDVYSLGAILFQLLTGKLPFDVGTSLRDALDRILYREPPRPSALLSATRGLRLDDELDTIVLKCLSKDPARRYQSAGELARDIGHYVAGEAIEAKRDSAMYVLRKTLRRYRLRAAVVIGFVILLGVFAAVMAVLYQRSSRLEQVATQAAGSLTSLLSESNIEQGRMAGLLGNLTRAENLLWPELLTARAPGSTIQTLTRPPGPPEAYWALWQLYRAYPCVLTLPSAANASRNATLARDGQGMWTITRSGVVERLGFDGQVYERYRTPATVPTGLPQIDATGRTVICTLDGKTFIASRDESDQWRTREVPFRLNAPLGSLFIAPDGTSVAAISAGQVTIYDLATDAIRRTFTTTGAPYTATGISYDGRRVAARDKLGGLYVWDLQTGEQLASIPWPAERVARHEFGALLFSPGGQLLADLWVELAGRVVNLDAAPPTVVELSERAGEYRYASFSPDERHLAVGDTGGVMRVYDVADGRRTITVAAHAVRIEQILFAPDGKGVWTCGDGDLRLWEFGTPGASQTTRIEGDLFHCIDAGGANDPAVAGGDRGALYLINKATLAERQIEFGNSATISCVAISPDGASIAAATYANAAFVWRTERLRDPPLHLTHPHRVSHVLFDPSGGRLVTACDDGKVRVWRSDDGSLLREKALTDDRIPQIAMDPAGRRVATAARDGSLKLWTIDGDVVDEWRPKTVRPLRTVRFSPDGSKLMTAGADRKLEIWDVASGRCIVALSGHTSEIYCLDVSSDGELVATGDSSGSIRLWSVGLQRSLATLEGHTAAVMSLDFTSEASPLFSASVDGTIRRWDLDYYKRHIAGQVEAQLQRLEQSKTDSEAARAWRDWAADARGSSKK